MSKSLVGTTRRPFCLDALGRTVLVALGHFMFATAGVQLVVVLNELISETGEPEMGR